MMKWWTNLVNKKQTVAEQLKQRNQEIQEICEETEKIALFLRQKLEVK